MLDTQPQSTCCLPLNMCSTTAPVIMSSSLRPRQRYYSVSKWLQTAEDCNNSRRVSFHSVLENVFCQSGRKVSNMMDISFQSLRLPLKQTSPSTVQGLTMVINHRIHSVAKLKPCTGSVFMLTGISVVSSVIR